MASDNLPATFRSKGDKTHTYGTVHAALLAPPATCSLQIWMRLTSCTNRKPNSCISPPNGRQSLILIPFSKPSSPPSFVPRLGIYTLLQPMPGTFLPLRVTYFGIVVDPNAPLGPNRAHSSPAPKPWSGPQRLPSAYFMRILNPPNASWRRGNRRI